MVSSYHLDQVGEAEIRITGKKVCSQCRSYRPAHGGTWLVFNKGKNRRWVCQACDAKRQEREQANAKAKAGGND